CPRSPRAAIAWSGSLSPRLTPARRPPTGAEVEAEAPCPAGARSCGEDQAVTAARLGHQAGRHPGGRKVTTQADDVRSKLLGGELRCAPGEVDQLGRGIELTGPAAEERQQLDFSPRERQVPAGIAEHPATNIQIESGQLPQAVLPEVEA